MVLPSQAQLQAAKAHVALNTLDRGVESEEIELLSWILAKLDLGGVGGGGGLTVGDIITAIDTSTDIQDLLDRWGVTTATAITSAQTGTTLARLRGIQANAESLLQLTAEILQVVRDGGIGTPYRTMYSFTLTSNASSEVTSVLSLNQPPELGSLFVIDNIESNATIYWGYNGGAPPERVLPPGTAVTLNKPIPEKIHFYCPTATAASPVIVKFEQGGYL